MNRLALGAILVTGLWLTSDVLRGEEPAAKAVPTAQGEVVTFDGCSCRFPGPAKQETSDIQDSQGRSVTLTQYSFEAEANHPRYVLSSYATGATAEQLKAEQPLDALRDAYKDQPKTELVVERKITLGSHPGRDFIWVGEGPVIRKWAFLIDGRLLQLTVSFDQNVYKEMTPSKLSLFFDTVRLDGDKIALGTFTNEKQGLIPSLQDRYVKFSFRYPAAWMLNRAGEDEGSSTYVDVDRKFPTEKSTYIIDSLTVGPLKLTGPPEAAELILPDLAKQLAEKLGKAWKDFKIESEGPIELQGASGYEVRFTASLEIPALNTPKLFGRLILLTGHKVGVPGGVTIMLNSTDVLAKITSVKELGEKGPMAEFVKSFKFEKE